MIEVTYVVATIGGICYRLFEEKQEASVCRQPLGNKYSGDVVIPDMVSYEGNMYDVRAIDYETFALVTGLKSVKFPAILKELRDGAFVECIGLERVVLPDTVEKIGERAFAGCVDLQEVTLGKCIGYIGQCAFDGCERLEKIVCYTITPPYFGAYAFRYIHRRAVMYVPECSVELYRRSVYGYRFNIMAIENEEVRG